MSSFTADWLACREPADAAARSSRLTRAIADHLSGRTMLNILDLATGTGANMRYLTGRLPRPQTWLLVDRDPRLLEAVPVNVNPGSAFTTRCADLAAGFEAARDLFADRDLVTASALLDLVSASWLEALARECRSWGAAVLFALTYDGRIQCAPEEPEDEAVRTLVNAHQRTDKGFGAALGPAASDETARLLTEAGYLVIRERSDWMLENDESELQQQLIEGWAEAAIAMSPERSLTIESWRSRRLAHIERGRSRLVVGHQDLAGWPLR